MFTEKDLQQIEKHGLTPDAVERQLENFRRGFPFLKVVRAASPGDGVMGVGDAGPWRVMNGRPTAWAL